MDHSTLENKKENSISKLQIAGAIAAIVVLVAMLQMPISETFPSQARNMLGVMLAVIILLVTEVFPIVVTCLLSIALMYFCGCTESVGGAISGFTNATLFFVLASFGISKAMTVVPILRRILLFLMNCFGKNTRQLLFAVMAVTMVLSSIISNVASAAVFIPLVKKFLEIYDDEEARRRTGKAFMIAIPVASMLGGMMTPAGSSINMLAINILEQNTGLTISFVQWMLIGIPIAAVMLPISWLICSATFKPAPLDSQKIKKYIENEQVELPNRLLLKEKYVICIILGMLLLWILSSWFPKIHVTAVALVGLGLFCLPGRAQVLTWNDYKNSISIEAFFLMGSMISMGNVVSESGLSVWIANVIFPSDFPSNVFLALLFICALTFVLLIPIPVAPAIVAMLSVPLIEFAGVIGLSPILAITAFELCASNCYLLPLDTVPLMTYVTGYYKMFDMPKVTWKIQVVLAVVCAMWLSVVGMIIL